MQLLPLLERASRYALPLVAGAMLAGTAVAKDIRIAHADYEPEHLSLFRLLTGVALLNKADNIPPNLGGEVLRAILEDLPYPTPLLNLAVQRCRAEQKPTYARAAVIKASLNRLIRRGNKTEREYLPMLDPANTNPAYRLGRLFAVLEKVQQEAIGNVNASIKDRYFTSACAAPASVFPILLRLSQHHIAKAEYGHISDRRIQEILNLLDVEHNPIPARLTLDEQGVFVLGYYHQRQAFFIKSDTTDNQEESK